MTYTIDTAQRISEFLKNKSVRDLPEFEPAFRGGPERMRVLQEEIEKDRATHPGRRYRIFWDTEGE